MKKYSLYDCIKKDISEKCGIDVNTLRFLKITSRTNRGIITLFLFEGNKKDPSFFVKLSNRKNSKAFIQNEFEALTKMTKISTLIATPISFFEEGSFCVSIARCVEGTPLANLRIGTKPIAVSDLADDLSCINKTLYELKSAHDVTESVSLKDILDDIKSRYRDFYDGNDSLLESLLQLDRIYASFIAAQMDVYVNHGDFALGHLFMKDGEVNGVVDWEYFGKIKLPFFDIFYCYITYYLFILNPMMNTATLKEMDVLFLDFKGEIKQLFGKGLASYFSKYGISDDMRYLFFFYSVAESMLRAKTIIGVPDDDPRLQFWKNCFKTNMGFFLKSIAPELTK